MALSDSGLIVRYYADEAASGQTPASLLDASGLTPADDLTITYGDNLSYTEVSGNSGLNSDSSSGSGIAQSGVLGAGDKLFDDLQGSTEATLEYVVDITEYNDGGGRLFGLMNGSNGNGTFLMTGDSFDGGSAEIRVNGSVVSNDVGTITGKHVIHLVMDSTQAAAADRLRLYIDGTLQAGIGASLGLNTTLSFSSTRLIVLNRPSNNRAVEGTFFYGAVYSEAFDQTRVTAHQTPISTDDDTPVASGFTADATLALADAALSADAELDLVANAVIGLDDAALVADASVVGTITADSVLTLGDVTLTSVTSLTGGLTASLTSTLDDALLTASAVTELAAALTTVLGDTTVASLVTLPNGASLVNTLDDVGLASAASVFILGDLNQTLDDVSLTSEATVITGRVVNFATTLNDVLMSSSTNVAIGVSVVSSLDDVAVASALSIDVTVDALGSALDDVTLSAVAGAVVRYIECTLVTREGVERPNLASLSWAWFDAPDPVNFIAPTDTGEIETTDGIGVINIQLPNSGLTTGQVGSLVLRADDGTLMAAYNLSVI